MKPTRCGKGCVWAQHGNRTGHCSGCHQTFSGLTAFDAHRRNGQCIDLSQVRDRSGALIYKRIVDEAGALVWRSAADLPEGTFERSAS